MLFEIFFIVFDCLSIRRTSLKKNVRKSNNDFCDFKQYIVAPTITGGNHEVSTASASTGKLRLTRSDNKSEFSQYRHCYDTVRSDMISVVASTQ